MASSWRSRLFRHYVAKETVVLADVLAQDLLCGLLTQWPDFNVLRDNIQNGSRGYSFLQDSGNGLQGIYAEYINKVRDSAQYIKKYSKRRVFAAGFSCKVGMRQTLTTPIELC